MRYFISVVSFFLGIFVGYAVSDQETQKLELQIEKIWDVPVFQRPTWEKPEAAYYTCNQRQYPAPGERNRGWGRDTRQDKGAI